MKVEADTVRWLQGIVDDPQLGVKVTAARIGIGRVTLWRILTFHTASARTLRLLAAFTETTETTKQITPRSRLCILKI